MDAQHRLMATRSATKGAHSTSEPSKPSLASISQPSSVSQQVAGSGNKQTKGKAVDTATEKKKTKKQKLGRRRRGKKDVILDFTKRAKKASSMPAEGDRQTKLARTDTADVSGEISAARKGRGRLSLATGSKDYGGNLGLPDKVTQREFESTGQFFRRLDRLVAKAKVEANLETRFDVTLNKNEDDE